MRRRLRSRLPRWLTVLDAYDAVISSAHETVNAFQHADWPRRQTDIWQHNERALVMGLVTCLAQLNELGCASVFH